jgi:hypothetical protein
MLGSQEALKELTIIFSVDSSTLKMGAIRSSETSVKF